MSSSRRLIVAAIGLVAAACGSPLPGSVDHEVQAFDPSQCLVVGSGCATSGSITSASGVGPGNLVVVLEEGASIDVPLQIEGNGDLLRYLAFGLNVVGVNDDVEELDVQLTGNALQPVLMPTGFQVAQIDEQRIVPPPGAHLMLTAKKGRFEIEYAVGLWDDP